MVLQAVKGFVSSAYNLLFETVISPIIDYVATNHRSKAMVLIVMPLSFLLRHALALRDWFLDQTLYSDKSMEAHATRVNRVVADVKQRLHRPAVERRKMCTARAPWQNLSTRFADYKRDSDCIFVGDLRNVLQLDRKAAVVTLEPLVEVGAVTKHLLPQGYMLAITLEIEEATVGGLACAVGMTTASHVHGLLQETVIEYEVILGDGRHIRARRDNEFSDIWHAFPWSHGTIGLLVGLTLKVVPVTSYVKITYTPVSGQEAYCGKIRESSLAQPAADFVEATVFSREECVVMEARFARDSEVISSMVNNVGLWFKPWFYTHVRDIMASGKVREEFIPVKQYIFRHNRAIFWTLRDQFPEKYGNHVLFRWLLGWMAPPKVTFLKLPATTRIRIEMMLERVYQDIVLPLRTLEEAINLAGDMFEIWPILVYPTRIYDHGTHMQGQFRKPRSEDIVPGTNYAIYYDLGVYGIPKLVQQGEKYKYKAVTSMRRMEHFTRQEGGAPFLYADTFMTRTEFESMFDLSLYERVRKKYNAEEHFPHLFDKTSGCQSFDWRKIQTAEKGR